MLQQKVSGGGKKRCAESERAKADPVRELRSQPAFSFLSVLTV
jgi:hypothetical protein